MLYLGRVALRGTILGLFRTGGVSRMRCDPAFGFPAAADRCILQFAGFGIMRRGHIHLHAANGAAEDRVPAAGA